MKTAFAMMSLCALLIAGCGPDTADEHAHDDSALSYTLYSDKTEVFVEFTPLIVGTRSAFAAHFTKLGESFTPLTEGSVTVSLIVGGRGIRNRADSPSSPGIYRLALNPTTAGMGRLIFDIEGDGFTDQIVIDNVEVYADAASVHVHAADDAGDISYLKEQAWKVDFANAAVRKQPFSGILRANGQILPAPGDEVLLTATTRGIVRRSGTRILAGASVSNGTALFTISGGNITEANSDLAFRQTKATYEKAKADYERSSELVKDTLISQRDFLQTKLTFDNAEAAYKAISANYSENGQRVVSPTGGFVKSILVNDGQFVEAGTPLASISQNRSLILQANVSQRHFAELRNISSATFRAVGSDTHYDTATMSGRLIAFGKSASADSPFLPIHFELPTISGLIPGSAAEVFLRTAPIPNALIVPTSALMEEQGTMYVYVQTSGERFQKRAVTLGANDGIHVQLLSGIAEGERVVTKGAYQIKLSAASGTMPDHGHEH